MQIAVIIFVTGVCLILFCSFACINSIFGAIQSLHRRQTWRTVAVQIVEWEPTRFDSESNSCTERVKYQYELSGTTYSGFTEISWGGEVGAEYLSRPYRIGDSLLIAYNPDQPAENVLAQDIEGGISALFEIPLLILFGVGIVGFIAFMLWTLLQDRIPWLFP